MLRVSGVWCFVGVMVRINLRIMITIGAMLLAGVLGGCAGGGGDSSPVTLVAPVVILTSPANNATGVLLTKPISVAFSKVMQPSAFTSATFTVTSGSGNVSGDIVYANGYVTFTPSAPMLPATLYTATVAAGVRDVDGVALTASYSWRFTTGPLDASFGNGGVVTTQVSPTLGSGARGVAVQADGRMVAVGYVDSGGGNYDFAMVRYHTDGSLDTTFGTNGKVITAISPRADEARAVAIQAAGQKIVVAGSSHNGTDADFVVARYNPDGTLDTTFNTVGYAVTNFGANANDEAFAVAIQTDNKIVVVGQTGTTPSTDFALVRYTMAGALDTTFGANGKQTTDFSGKADVAYAVAIQGDGKIVVAGIADQGAVTSINNDFALARYDANGALDATFGSSGKVTTAVGAADEGAFAIGIQTGGKIIAAGVVFNGTNNDFGLVRYNTNGTLDTTFGPASALPGTVITDMAGGNDAALALAIQADGSIVVAGAAFVTGQGNDLATARYSVDGSLDVSFDADGKVITNVSALADVAYAVSLLSGKIVMAGSSGTGNNSTFLLVGFAP